MRFEIEFYSSEDGKEPVADFLDSLKYWRKRGQNFECLIPNILRTVFLSFAVNKEVTLRE